MTHPEFNIQDSSWHTALTPTPTGEGAKKGEGKDRWFEDFSTQKRCKILEPAFSPLSPVFTEAEEGAGG
jgi:hypothetical protein